MGFTSFFRRASNNVRSIGHSINRSWNVVKSHVKPILHKVGTAASMVKEAASYFNDLPIVGAYSSEVGAVAGMVEKGIGVLNRGISTVEGWQQKAGYDTSNPVPGVNVQSRNLL